MDKIKFATFIAFVQLKCKHMLIAQDVSEIDGMLTDMQPKIVASEFTSTEKVDELLAQLNNPQGLISAIKAYRALTNAGLKEAKDTIEKYRTIPKDN